MLGPRPGSRKRANKLNKSGLGRSLVNQKKKENKVDVSDRHTTDINSYGSGSNLKSVTEQRPLDELLSTAELAGKDFTTERTAAIKVVSKPNELAQVTPEQREHLIQQHYDNAGKLTVPRRPKWTSKTTPQELDVLEKEAFLAWRRSLASLQENPQFELTVTPFERNIEVWKQLWRVIERSHLIVQIVDARNPLLYRSEDLDKYAKEFGTKNTLLLVNKADLLTNNQREIWQAYFKKHNIPFAFYSAKNAAVDDSDNDTKNNVDASVDAGVGTDDVNPPNELQNTTRILSVKELHDLFIQASPEIKEGELLQIGLVGYPNVGKSSSINSLIGSKKVSVSSTPGKTKHFQTIKLSDDLMLCDCPGLVFPNFAQTKSELVCQGVLPIDQLRDYMSPTSLVTKRIPKEFFERLYGIKLHTNPVTALDLLNTYAEYRGYTRTGGGPDGSRAARLVLKDYVNAKLPFCIPPPDYEHTDLEFNDESFKILIPQTEEEKVDDNSTGEGAKTQPVNQVNSMMKQVKMEDEELEDELDKSFFTGNNDMGTASLPFHLRGKQGGKSTKKHNKGRKGKN